MPMLLKQTKVEHKICSKVNFISLGFNIVLGLELVHLAYLVNVTFYKGKYNIYNIDTK